MIPADKIKTRRKTEVHFTLLLAMVSKDKNQYKGDTRGIKGERLSFALEGLVVCTLIWEGGYL